MVGSAGDLGGSYLALSQVPCVGLVLLVLCLVCSLCDESLFMSV